MNIPRQAQGKSRSSKNPVKETGKGRSLNDSGNVSIIVKDNEIYRKTMRAGVRQKMQPAVSDEGEEEPDQEDITEPLTSPSLNQPPPESTMSLPIDLLEDDLTRPLGESTPTQRTLDSNIASKEHTLEDGFDFATSLAHRIQRTPASAKKLEPEYSINLSTNASELLADGLYRPETFPRNDSFVRDYPDPNVAFSDRVRDIRPDNTSNTPRRPESSKVDDDEMESLHQQLEQMKSALAQKDETINVLQSQLLAKEAKCEELHVVLQDRSSAMAAAESREAALKHAVRAAEEQTVAVTATAADRFAIVKDALITAEDEAAMAAERAKDTVSAAEARANTAEKRCGRLEREVRELTASARAARAEAKRAREERAEREALWEERSEILLKECDRRGRALMVKIGEIELPGVRDERGRQAYQYQRRGERNGADVGRR